MSRSSTNGTNPQIIEEQSRPDKMENPNKEEKREELVALMQRSLDGTFYFSSPAPKKLVDSISKREISKIRILPSASIGRVSNLGASLLRPHQRRGVRKPLPTGKLLLSDYLDLFASIS